MDQDVDYSQYKKLPRLFVGEAALAPGAEFPLAEAQAHYVGNVMRLGAGDSLRVFNGRDGEWIARISAAQKRKIFATPEKRVRAQEKGADVTVLASPVRKTFELMVEKATELGAARILPVICAHTVVRRVNEDRLRAIATEAAEQCERLDVPEILPAAGLEEVLSRWTGKPVVFCHERASAPPIAQVAATLRGAGGFAVLVGPEGGFSPEEAAFLAGLGNNIVRPASLGPRILRAETALCAALSCLQAGCGDWTG